MGDWKIESQCYKISDKNNLFQYTIIIYLENRNTQEIKLNNNNILYIEVIDLNPKIQESYTKDGKELFQLIQEWIDENNSFLYCKDEKKEPKYYYE